MSRRGKTGSNRRSWIDGRKGFLPFCHRCFGRANVFGNSCPDAEEKMSVFFLSSKRKRALLAFHRKTGASSNKSLFSTKNPKEILKSPSDFFAFACVFRLADRGRFYLSVTIFAGRAALCLLIGDSFRPPPACQRGFLLSGLQSPSERQCFAFDKGARCYSMKSFRVPARLPLSPAWLMTSSVKALSMATLVTEV